MAERSIPDNLLRVNRSIPVVAHPDSVTHWTCPSAPEAGTTHHIIFTAGSRCQYCKETSHTLRQRHMRLLTPIFDQAGTKILAFQITSWTNLYGGRFEIHWEDASGNDRRSHFPVRETLRALEATSH